MVTTVNVHSFILDKILAAAEMKGVTRSAMIVLLLRKVMGEYEKKVRMARLVQYQERSVHEEWNTVHVKFMADEYEYFLDLRKLLKMSVSLILANAVKKYLKEPNLDEISDKNRFINYLILHELVDGIDCWRLYWGIPPIFEDLIKF